MFNAATIGYATPAATLLNTANNSMYCTLTLPLRHGQSLTGPIYASQPYIHIEGHIETHYWRADGDTFSGLRAETQLLRHIRHIRHIHYRIRHAVRQSHYWMWGKYGQNTNGHHVIRVWLVTPIWNNRSPIRHHAEYWYRRSIMCVTTNTYRIIPHE